MVSQTISLDRKNTEHLREDYDPLYRKLRARTIFESINRYLGQTKTFPIQGLYIANNFLSRKIPLENNMRLTKFQKKVS